MLRRRRAAMREAAKPHAYVIEEFAPAGPVNPDTELKASVAIVAGDRPAQRSRRRIGMCAVVFAAAFSLLGARLFAVATGGQSVFAAGTFPAADEARPEIVDRRGRILATNLPVVALEVYGRETWDPGQTVSILSDVVKIDDADDLERRLRAGSYVEVARDLTPAQKDAVFRLGLPGVRFRSRERRYYPQGALGAHVVGHTEPGKGGVMGLEAHLDARGRARRLQAALDIRAQQAVEAELAAAVKKHHAQAGWAGVMDVRTGEMIALANFPEFDPNAPGDSQADARRNRATYDRYELGSAFKAITAAAALDAGAATPVSTYDARGAYRVADRTIRDFHGENRILTFSEVVQYSSNIGMARIAADLGVDDHRAYLKALGLLDKLPIELRENRAPQPPAKWGPVEAATISYGHGISVTPLHLLAAFGAVVNGGEYRAPTFLQGSPKAAGGRRVFAEETSAQMRRILRRVVTDGTASLAEAPGYFPIGKTATADKPARGGYDGNARIASFVGAFPGAAPRYAVLVSLDEPQVIPETKGFATAGWNAAPTFARIVERIAPVLGVMPAGGAETSAFFRARPVSLSRLEPSMAEVPSP